MICFKDILRPIKPQFFILNAENTIPNKELFIAYAPISPLMVDAMKHLSYRNTPKGFKEPSSINPILENWKTDKAKNYTYIAIIFEDVLLVENVSYYSITTENMNRSYHLLSITYSSPVIGNYGYELSLSRDLLSPYLALMHIIKCILFVFDKNLKIPKISVTGLPNSVYYELHWPCVQLLFYYLIFGIIILHIKTVRRLSRKCVVPQKGWYTIANYFIIALLYHSVCFLIFVFTSLALCTDYFNAKIINSIPWYTLLATFFINTNTILIFGMALSEFNISTYNALYFIGMIICPQLLYIFAFGQNNGAYCGFQYLTSLSPFFAIGWSLTTLEDHQAKRRYAIAFFTLDEEYLNECFSFKMSINFQLIHSGLGLLFIFYMNFLNDILMDFIPKFEKSRNIRTMKKANINKRKRKHFTSLESPAISRDSFLENQVIFPKSDYIITLNKVMKLFYLNGCWRKILKDVSVKFRKNKITTILGPNGSGKTTLLSILSGLLPFNSGKLIINGYNVKKNRKEAFQNISKYIDDTRIFSFLTVGEYFQLIIRKNQKNNNSEKLGKHLKDFIGICQIEKYIRITLNSCPMSIIRVIKIICTFLSEKPVVLLDDPMEGLDYILMQSVCALFANQKSFKTIIYTSCNSNTIEYISDSVVVLINGRKVSQADVENFHINKMLYRLMCSVEAKMSDYTLIRYLKQAFPSVRFDETIDGISYFSVPKMDVDEIWKLLNSLDRYGLKLGIWRYKFVAIGMRNFLSNAYDLYLKKKKKKRINFNQYDLLPEKIKQKSEIYKRYFGLFLTQRIMFFCRYPNRLFMRFIIPILVLFVWVHSTSLSHPTILFMDHGFYLSSYVEEITENYQIFIACEGAHNSCSIIFDKLQNNVSFITKVNTFNYKSNSSSFPIFQTYLFDKGQTDYLEYNNFTLFGLYFTILTDDEMKAIVLANDYKSQIFAYNLADNIIMSPKSVFIKRLERSDLTIHIEEVEINFLMRLIMIILFAYALSTYRYISQNVHQQFYMIHDLAGINFSILHLPTYIMDVFSYLLIMCFMILLLYVMEDHEITAIQGNVFDILLVFMFFVLADSSFKLLIQNISNYNTLIIFVFYCIDVFIVFFLNVIYMINYIIKIQKFSYAGVKVHNLNFYMFDKLFQIIFPSASLNAALKSITDKRSGNIKGVLVLQCVFYMLILFIWHQEKFRIKELINKYRHGSILLKKPRVKNLGKENSFLFIKDLSLIKNRRLYFENVSIEFKQGTVWGIIGRNNSGKTDFLKIIIGKNLPTTGGIYLYNQYVRIRNFKERGVKIGYCSEKIFYVSDLTVQETLMYWGRLKLLPENNLKNFICEISTILLLNNDLHTRMKQLSKTNVKKLDIAVAIIGYPEIIILDDPLSNLDSLSRHGVINLVERAKIRNCMILVTASEISELRHILTNIAILSHDRLEYHGKFVEAILQSKLGYYLTIFLNEEALPDDFNNKLTDLITKSFTNSSLFKVYPSHFIYFLPFQSLTDPNTTKILLFMETIRNKFGFERYLIKYDVFFSNS